MVGEKRNKIDKLGKVFSKKHIIYYSIIISLSIFFLLIYSALSFMTYPGNGDYTSAELVGKYSLDNEHWEKYNGQLDVNGDYVKVVGYFTKDIPANKILFMTIHNIQVHLFINGELKYSFGEKGTYPTYSSTPGYAYGFYESPGITTKDEITIILEKKESNLFQAAFQQFFSNMSVMQGFEIYQIAWREKFVEVIISISLFIIGVVTLVIGSAVWGKKENSLLRIASFSNFCIAGSFYFLADSLYEYMPIFIPNPVLCNILDVAPVSLITMGYIIYYYSNLEWSDSNFFLKVVLIVGNLGCCLGMLFQLVGVMNIYEGQWLAIIPCCLSATVCLLFSVYEGFWKNNLNAKYACSTFFIMNVAGLLETINAVKHFMPSRVSIRIAIIIAVFLQGYQVYVFGRKQQEKELYQQKLENELSEKKTLLMLSQIQPHFLFNSLNSIEQLCEENPLKAQEAIEYFSSFLRTNIDSLKYKKLSSFENEVDHVKNYIALEKMRYEEKLDVSYDLAVKGFMLPILTLQPIVENAVKHGLFPKEKGGKIIIKSYEDEDYYYISVEDNGVGFNKDIIINDGKAHIGVSNVKARLQEQLDGSLQIESEIGKGTVVTIAIPKGEI